MKKCKCIKNYYYNIDLEHIKNQFYDYYINKDDNYIYIENEPKTAFSMFPIESNSYEADFKEYFINIKDERKQKLEKLKTHDTK